MVLADTSSKTTTVFQLDVAVTALVFGVVLAILTGLVEVLRREPRIEPGPRTLDTPPQPPAVAALLTHTREVPGEAVAATLVDLAARDVVEIFDMGGGEPGVRVHAAGTEQLTPYEQRVLELVRRYADGSGVAPGRALALADDKAAAAWLREFRDEVRSEASSGGWVRRRYGREVVVLTALLLGGGLAVALWGFATATTVPEHSTIKVPQQTLRNGVTFAALAVGVLDLMLLGRLGASSAQRLTASGQMLAAKWIGVAAHLGDDEQLADAPPMAVAVWHRLLAYATAFGVAQGVQQALPLGPESPTRAWSSVTGRWRLVEVDYPQHWPPGWGSRPGEQLYAGVVKLIQSAVPVAVIVTLGRKLLEGGFFHDVHVPLWGYAIGAVIVGAFLLTMVSGAFQVVVGLAQMCAVFSPGRELAGRAIRVRPRKGAGTWVAIDDGTRDEIVAVVIRDPSQSVAQGDEVRLRVRALTGVVTSVAPLTQAVTPHANAPA